MSISITSLQNPKIKFALSLRKPSVRRKENLFLIEGCREIRLAMQAGYRFHTLIMCCGDDQPGDSDINDIAGILTGQAVIIETSRNVFGKLAYREGSGRMIAIAHQKKTTLSEIKPGTNPLVLVAESIEKPGNLGAMLRTADAAGVNAVIVCDSGTDIYNPNVVRSSLGTIFTVPVVCCSSGDAIKWLKKMNIKIYATALTASRPYNTADFTSPSAIVAGAEATGVSLIWQENSDLNIIIPMFGKVDSMNVSVATSVVLYEALRQRRFSPHK